MRRDALLWVLWAALSAVIVLACAQETRPGEGFLGQTGRILYVHVPNAWTSFVAFVAAGVWSVRYLMGGRRSEDDRAAAVAVELGLLFGLLATITGSIWARIQWGAWWNWDPRQTSVVLALLFYGAYLALRGAVEDEEVRARTCAAYAAFGLVVAPFLYFVLPRLSYSLHPEPVINAAGRIEMAPWMLGTLLLAAASFSGLFFWMHGLRRRILRLELA